MSAEASSYPRSIKTLAIQYRKFFSSTVIAVLLLQITLVTDTILVGRILGSVPMSGVRVATPVVSLLNAFAMLIGVGSTTLISVAMGKRRREEADRLFTVAIMCCIVFGVAFSLILAPFASQIAHLISTSAEAVPYTETFLRIVGIASPLYVLASAMAMILRTDSCIRLSSIVLSAAGVANVCFDLLFMGVLHMGIEGAALATDCGMLVGVLISLRYFFWPHRTLHLTRHLAAEDEPGVISVVGRIISGGAASALRLFLSSMSLIFLNYVVGDIVGVEGIALLTVCGSVQLLATTFFSAGGQAATPMEGVLFGEGDNHGLRLLVAYVLKIVLSLVVGVTILIWIFPNQIYALFVPTGGIAGAAWYLRLYALSFAPLSVNYVLMYYYSTIGKRVIALALSICENLIFYLPLIWVLTHTLGLMGAVAAYAATELVTLATVLIMAAITARRTHTHGVLLLPEDSADLAFEATVPARPEAPAALAHEVKEALGRVGVEETMALRTAIAVEEMLANAAIGGRPRTPHVPYFDVRVSATPAWVRVALRDTGAPFDPTTYEADADEYEVDGIEFMRSLASSITYSQALGMNQTIIEIDRPS